MYRRGYDTYRQYAEHRAWDQCRELSFTDLLSLLHDKNAVLRYAAANRLKLEGDMSIVEHAIGLTSSKDYKLREIGAYILGAIKIPLKRKIREVMLRLGDLTLNDKSVRVRYSSIYSMGKRYWENFSEYDLIIPMLYASVNSPYSSIRMAVACSLSKIVDERIIPLLENLIHDSDQDIRDWTALSVQLSEQDSPEIRNGLLAMVNNDKEMQEARWEAISALAQLRDERVIPALKEELDIKKDRIDDDMIRAAANLGDSQFIPILEELMDNFDDDDGLIKLSIKQLKKR